jgi:phosphoribosylformylglycinamidine cyclo-ligase
MARRHDTVGQDLVNHCVNDILVQGARPLFFMDYIGTARFDSAVFNPVIAGLCKACRENGCALLGGETAELPGLYPPGDYDLVGTIVGVVDRRKLILGTKIRPGDAVIGLPSTGLHTNGYSLARKIIFEQARLKINSRLPGTNQTVADALLAIHRSYLKPVSALMKKVRIQAMAHITGGGFYDNIPRVLPRDIDVVIDRAAWQPPALFRFLQEKGRVDRDEMYRVFNMGIGMVIIVRSRDLPQALRILKAQKAGPRVIGVTRKGSRRAILEN